MASVLKILRQTTSRKTTNLIRQYHKSSFINGFNIRPLQVITVIGGTIALYSLYKTRTSQSLKALKSKNVSSCMKCIGYVGN